MAPALALHLLDKHCRNACEIQIGGKRICDRGQLRSAVLPAITLGNGVWNTSGGIVPVLQRLYGATLPVFAEASKIGRAHV